MDDELRELREQLAREKARTTAAERKAKSIERAAKVTKAGDDMQQVGSKMQGCGCLMTLFITIPLLLLLF